MEVYDARFYPFIKKIAWEKLPIKQRPLMVQKYSFRIEDKISSSYILQQKTQSQEIRQSKSKNGKIYLKIDQIIVLCV